MAALEIDTGLYFSLCFFFYYYYYFFFLSGRKGSRADEEEPDLGVSYEVLPAGAGELPEVRNLCFGYYVDYTKTLYILLGVEISLGVYEGVNLNT